MLPFALYNLNLEHLNSVSERAGQGEGTGETAGGAVSTAADHSLPYVGHLGAVTTDNMEEDRLLLLLLPNSTVDGPFFNKHVALRVTVGTTCVLSMLGALLIILSYFLIRDIQTKSRQILVHLSFADFGVSCSNFIGVTVYFDQYIRNCPDGNVSSSPQGKGGYVMTVSNGVNSVVSCGALRGLCKAQAFFAGYSTLASVLWTLCLAVYIYCLVVHSSKRVHLKVVYVAYLLCWGLPLFVSLWLIATGRCVDSLT